MRESYVIRDSHSTYKTVNYHYKSISCTMITGFNVDLRPLGKG